MLIHARLLQDRQSDKGVHDLILHSEILERRQVKRTPSDQDGENSGDSGTFLMEMFRYFPSTPLPRAPPL